jgi:hypothetical protein
VPRQYGRGRSKLSNDSNAESRTALESDFRVVGRDSANLPTLDYPAGPEKLAAFSEYYGQFGQVELQLHNFNAQIATLYSELLASPPVTMLTAIRMADIFIDALTCPSDLNAAQ